MATCVGLAFLCVAVLFHVATAAEIVRCHEKMEVQSGIAIVYGDCEDSCSHFKIMCPGYTCSCYVTNEDVCILNVKRQLRMHHAFCLLPILSEKQAERFILDAEVGHGKEFENIFWPLPWSPAKKSPKPEPSTVPSHSPSVIAPPAVGSEPAVGMGDVLDGLSKRDLPEGDENH